VSMEKRRGELLGFTDEGKVKSNSDDLFNYRQSAKLKISVSPAIL
jgi:hypothetical protein